MNKINLLIKVLFASISVILLIMLMLAKKEAKGTPEEKRESLIDTTDAGMYIMSVEDLNQIYQSGFDDGLKKCQEQVGRDWEKVRIISFKIDSLLKK